MISVLIASYGSDDWKHLATTRAFPTAEREQPDEIILHHDPDGDVADARNEAAQQAEGDWLVFLDADDELAPGFIRAMRKAIIAHANRDDPTRTLFTPMVVQIINGRRKAARFHHPVDLRQANWLVIGTMIHRTLFDEVGGFEPWPHGLEDWHLWTRCHKHGAHVVKVNRAIYVAHWNHDSKHHVLQRNPKEHQHWYEKARASVWGEA